MPAQRRTKATHETGRPYRSHLSPACLSCRQRKSRCKVDKESEPCLVCRLHATPCVFPHVSETQANSTTDRNQGALLDEGVARGEPRPPTDFYMLERPAFSDMLPPDPVLEQSTPIHVVERPMNAQQDEAAYPSISMLEGASDQNPHIIGPAVITDSHVLRDYLSTIPQASGIMQNIRPISVTAAPGMFKKPVMFTAVRKRPLGMSGHQEESSVKCQIIEKLVEPYAEILIGLYLDKSNICFPLFDKSDFMRQYRESKDKISPALLCSIYANAMIYWNSSPILRLQRCPDVRFMWVQTSGALYSELLLWPGISTVMTIVISVGGRPTTSMIGNAVTIASAVSLCYSLGLNHDPTTWDIAAEEKNIRIRVWWIVLIHDRWCSLAYGTPPHTQPDQHDIPVPEIGHLCRQTAREIDITAASIFTALARLTNVLGVCLAYIYKANKDIDARQQVQNLETSLEMWKEEEADDAVQSIITRGTNLNEAGAANLRLAYLSIKLLIRRIDLDSNDSDRPLAIVHRRLKAQRAAEDVVHFVQELNEPQLNGFWLPVSAFAFSSATMLLLRCALENSYEVSPDKTAMAHGLSQSPALKRARDLISALRSHREKFGWELGDICLAQCAEMVEKLSTMQQSPQQETTDLELQALFASDMPILDELFPSLWDLVND